MFREEGFYKGTLNDYRVAAVKCLNEAHQGEAKF